MGQWVKFYQVVLSQFLAPGLYFHIGYHAFSVFLCFTFKKAKKYQLTLALGTKVSSPDILKNLFIGKCFTKSLLVKLNQFTETI